MQKYFTFEYDGESFYKEAYIEFRRDEESSRVETCNEWT